MAVDGDTIDNGVTKGKAVVVLHTWKDHLWALGSKSDPPDAIPVADDEATVSASGDSDSADENGPNAGPEPAAENPPVATEEGTEEIEKLTPEGAVAVHCTLCLSSRSPPITPEVSTRLRAALLQALQTSLAALPNSAFPMPTTILYTAHILPARPFSRTATTPVDIKHSAFKSLSAFLRVSEKGGLLKLKDARPDVVVAAVFPKHADVVAHQPHRTVGEEDERRRRAEEREAQQAAEAANAEKAITVTELWKPHLGTLPLFADLGLE